MGTVAAVYQQGGSLLAPGASVVRLITSDDMWIRFALPPSKLKEVAPDTKVQALIENRGRPVEGSVKHVAPEVESASQMVFVEAKLDLPKEEKQALQTGAKARVFIAAAPAAGK
jgi:membrane fusion protein (multidrug efflux system)/multidrug efflux system membrane fusion protein